LISSSTALAAILLQLPTPDQAKAVEDYFLGFSFLLLVMAVAWLFYYWRKDTLDRVQRDVKLQVKLAEVMVAQTAAMNGLTKSIESLTLANTSQTNEIITHVSEQNRELKDFIRDLNTHTK
jgi:hypothetical protein